ncbi:hypothetical protein [Coxiella burnetii]|uniref:Uncharacterized protein n=2 Tax=Coxiella burnetii TaxID=777 RepID=Q83FB5_COXBU|nr:hypothetical protein [Coxiella burnetii]NP_819081.1 hypothetical protein CBU_0025 [Coxiella burnetii RSA 493]AAO89595.1 hypothetical protein CBU_0025 [Coxiella burnetii RSA 493]ABX78802.1 hypothetical protein COXBURSA331_A2179 [Coxiella burnetii RSA 331]ACI23063.1 hypothetical protein CBUD_0146a [Coxiella burnetii Dugway 5J108-111]ACJ17730.1 hypothetical cytosolic protein [Coxiella burnetii CbuG_Q212]AML48142.1 hypothetical protein AUR58_02325 [Coxiella burnetii]
MTSHLRTREIAVSLTLPFLSRESIESYRVLRGIEKGNEVS